MCRFEPPRLCLSVTDTTGNEYTLLLFTPFQVQTHVMPGGKEVIVLKATRPTASCLAWRVRPEESLAGHRALSGLNVRGEGGAADKTERGFSWTEREKSGGAENPLEPASG